MTKVSMFRSRWIGGTDWVLFVCVVVLSGTKSIRRLSVCLSDVSVSKGSRLPVYRTSAFPLNVFCTVPAASRARPVFQRSIGSPVPSNCQCLLIPAYVCFILLSLLSPLGFCLPATSRPHRSESCTIIFSANRLPGCLWFLALGAEGAGFVSNFLVILANTLAPSNGSCSISQGEHSTYDTVGNFEPTDIDS
jgi:hypothetical protein